MASEPQHVRRSSWDEEDLDGDDAGPPPLKQVQRPPPLPQEQQGAPPRRGRRAAAAATSSGDPAPSSGSGWGATAEAAPPAGAAAADGEPRHGRRRGGAEAGSPSEKRARDRFEEAEMVTDIMEIPDLDDVADDDITRTVAEAPQVRDTRVQSLRELDHEIAFKSGGEEGVDLSLLTAVLLPQEQVVEHDTPWNHDALYARIAGEFETEKERAAAAAADGGGGGEGSSGGEGGRAGETAPSTPPVAQY